MFRYPFGQQHAAIVTNSDNDAIPYVCVLLLYYYLYFVQLGCSELNMLHMDAYACVVGMVPCAYRCACVRRCELLCAMNTNNFLMNSSTVV